MEYNIYQKEMVGNDFLVDTMLANTKENALNLYININNIPESEKWMYYVVSKEKDDEDKRILKEAGCKNWDEYYNNMYPSRTIEL